MDIGPVQKVGGKGRWSEEKQRREEKRANKKIPKMTTRWQQEYNI